MKPTIMEKGMSPTTRAAAGKIGNRVSQTARGSNTENANKTSNELVSPSARDFLAR